MGLEVHGSCSTSAVYGVEAKKVARSVAGYGGIWGQSLTAGVQLGFSGDLRWQEVLARAGSRW